MKTLFCYILFSVLYWYWNSLVQLQEVVVSILLSESASKEDRVRYQCGIWDFSISEAGTTHVLY